MPSDVLSVAWLHTRSGEQEHACTGSERRCEYVVPSRARACVCVLSVCVLSVRVCVCVLSVCVCA